MQINFIPAVSRDAVLVVMPVAKDGLTQTIWTSVGEGGAPIAVAAASAARFTGEAGTSAELFVPGDTVRRVLLLGIGAGAEGDWTKAGGALVAAQEHRLDRPERVGQRRDRGGADVCGRHGGDPLATE